ncbi:hypothetical protein Trisim1_010585 [Trichoderma cf. simile WF8]
MSLHRTISSNVIGPGVQIHQGDMVINNYNSSVQPKARRVIPFGRNEDFIHRPKIIAQVNRLLSPAKEGECCSAALWGLSGSGKTQIALDYAYRRSRDDPDCAIFWVHADNEITFERDYRTIARKLGLDYKLSSEELLFTVCDYIDSQPRWLLILDNADDLTQFGVSAGSTCTLDQAKSLAKYIPQGPGGSILWTSCNKQIVALAGPRRGVQVTLMIDKEAKELLTVARDKKIHNNEIQDAKSLLEELQWLPLAISQAALYMRRTSTPIKEYLSELLKSRWEILKNAEHDKYRRPGIPNSILETWDISIKRILQESKISYDILHTIAYLDNQNIPFSILLAIFTRDIKISKQETLYEEKKKALKSAIIRLEAFSLIRARNTEDDELSFDMHKLIQEAIRYRLSQEDSRSGAYFYGIALSAIMDLFPENKPETWSLCEKYAAHAIRVSDWAETFEGEIFTSEVEPSHFLSFLGEVSSYIYGCGLWPKTALLGERELHIQKKAFGEEHPRTILYMCKLSQIYLHQGLFKEAEEFGLRALTLSQTVNGEKDPTTMTMMKGLMRIYFRQGQFKVAEELQMKALSLLQEAHGEKHLDTIEAMNDLASLYDSQLQFDKAMELRTKALAICYKVLGEEHRLTLDVTQSLAITYAGKKDYRKAEKLQLKILSQQQKVHGEPHPEIITAMGHLSFIYHNQGRYDKNREFQSRIFLQKQKIHGEKHPETIRTMMDLALAYCLEGKFILAEELQVKALTLFLEVLGEKHVETISAMGTAAFIYHQQGLIEKGDELEKRAFFLRQEVYGEKSPAALWHLDDFAAKRRKEVSTKRIVAASVKRSEAASTKHGKRTAMSRRMAAFFRRKATSPTKRRKESPISRRMAAFIKRRTARTSNYRYFS